MQTFKLNEAMVNFLGLEQSARCYAEVMELWSAYRHKLDIDVHVVKYEDLVQDLEGTCKPLIAFLGLAWADNLHNYQKTALEASASWLFKNFWNLTLTADAAPRWYNDFFEMQTPSSLFKTPRQPLKRSPYYSLFADGSTDNRKPLIVSWLIGGAVCFH